MIDLTYLRSFFPPAIANNSRFDRYMLKEYLQLMILDHIATSPYAPQLAFIGGTNLRLIQGIDRFSEDLDFDCKSMDEANFMNMTDSIIRFLRCYNIEVEPRDVANPKLTAFRRNLHFPQMLFNMGLSGHRDERLLIKIEAQDQTFVYQPEVVNINKMGFFFNVQMPPMPVLCSMKLSALLGRRKGRDFYDSLFLLSKTQPDYGYLALKNGISNLNDLKSAMKILQQQVDINQKKRDFQHLLFREENAERITHFFEYISKLL